MTVLFSPVGTADPITQLGDGPMLHIARHFRPDKIYLFLSPKMAGYQDADQRYTKTIEWLYKSLNLPLPAVELIRSENLEVHRFDLYIKEYEDDLRHIRKACHITKNSQERILVNASSGTPAMEQAAVALGALGWLPLQLIQVETPNHDVNKKEDRESPDDYEAELMWECNPDNDVTQSCRAHTVDLPNFRDRIVRDSVISLVDSYDYGAALQLVEESENFPINAQHKISEALDRLNLVRVPKKEELLVSFLWMLEVKRRRKQWADFVLGLTPALMETMELVLDPVLPRGSYLRTGKEDGTYSNILNLTLIEQDARLSAHFRRDINQGGTRYLKNAALIRLVEDYCPDDSRLPKLRTVRTFEEGTRNLFAHELRKVEKNEIEREGKASFEEVMQLLFEVNGIPKTRFIFDALNKEIVDLIKRG